MEKTRVSRNFANKDLRAEKFYQGDIDTEIWVILGRIGLCYKAYNKITIPINKYY